MSDENITTCVDFSVPWQHPCFAAHFPGNPIVPGALLLQWIMAAAVEQGVAGRIGDVKSFKFLQTLLPGEQCRFEFHREAAQAGIKAVCYRDGTAICKGVLVAGS